MRWIPLEEVMEKHVNKPGFAEGCEQARHEFEEDIAKYGTIDNPKPQPHPVFARSTTKRKSRGLLTRQSRERATA